MRVVPVKFGSSSRSDDKTGRNFIPGVSSKSVSFRRSESRSNDKSGQIVSGPVLSWSGTGLAVGEATINFKLDCGEAKGVDRALVAGGSISSGATGKRSRRASQGASRLDCRGKECQKPVRFG